MITNKFNKMKKGFITIDYDEPKAKTYRGVHLIVDEITYKFSSGNFVKDWFEMNKFISFSDLTGAGMSSTYTHFFMDGAKFNSAWLKVNDENVELVYEYEDNLIEFFVPYNKVWNWEKLKKYCKK